MPAFCRFILFTLTLAFLGVASVSGEEQAAEQPDPPQLVKTTLTDGIDRIAGQEPTSRIQYVRLALAGSLHPAATANSPTPSSAPTLIAQCTLRPNGKSYFE